MAKGTDLPQRHTGSTRDEHISDHNRLHAQANTCVHSCDYVYLQDAVNDAIEWQRPLIIAPGVHTLTAPLVVDRGYTLHILAYGARINAGGNLSSLVELRDCVRCTWRGGWLHVPVEYTVANAFYIYREDGQCTRNAVYDLTVEGNYRTGIRIGRQTDAGQCDHMALNNIECLGVEAAGQVGIVAGTGVFANCLNHTFNHIMLSGHDIHARIEATNTYWRGVFCDRANIDFYLGATQFDLRDVRSEDGHRFLVTAGPAGYATTLNCENILWNAQVIDADGQWIQARLAGLLTLRNMTVLNPPQGVTPVIRADPGAAMIVSIDGMVSASAKEDAVSATQRVTATISNYVQISSGGAVVEINP